MTPSARRDARSSRSSRPSPHRLPPATSPTSARASSRWNASTAAIFARGYDHVVHGTGAHFVWLNRGKESMAVDLKCERGPRDRAAADRPCRRLPAEPRARRRRAAGSGR